MNRPNPATPACRRPPCHQRRHESGLALAVSLILLLVVTLVGLAAVRATTSQQKMSANFYDRELAFQNAEAGLRVAADALLTEVPGRNCIGLDASGNACGVNPFTDPNLPNNAIRSVATGAYTRGDAASGQPQYVVENLGLWNDPILDTGFDQTANAAQYGAQGTTLQSVHYRITARSDDPAAAGDRAVVTLQAYYRR